MNNKKELYYKEKNSHGTSSYPFTIYNVQIPDTFDHFPLHYHDEVEIIHVQKGKGIITVNLEPCTATEDTILIISPGILHSIEQYQEDTFRYRNIIFDLKMVLTHTTDESTLNFILPILTNKIYFPLIIDKEHVLNSTLTELLNTLKKIHDGKLPGYELGIKSQIMLMLYLFTTNGLLQKNKNFLKSSVVKLKKIISYLQEHYGEPITIQEAAALYGSSPSNFMRFFKNTTGISFIRYLNDYRLDIAEEQLLTTSDSILDIAINAGFNSLSYFNRMFKNKYQESPTGYRKKHRIEAMSGSTSKGIAEQKYY